jgi:hypothetical protein
MAAILTGKVRGLTAASATIATIDVEFHDDGSVRFTDAAGTKHRFMPSASLNALLKAAFVGAGGFATSKKWFGVS